mgnify:CR=1 FL=1
MTEEYNSNLKEDLELIARLEREEIQDIVIETLRDFGYDDVASAYASYRNDQSKYREIVNKIKSGISSAWNGLVSWFNSLWNSLFSNRNVNVNVGYGGSTRSSRAGGLDYVPYDGYIAMLHKGEKVLTADEAKGYNGNRTGVVNVVQNIYSEAKTAADLMQEAIYQQEMAVFLSV